MHKRITGKETLDLFEKQNLVKYIYSMYQTYHTERVNNAIEDIDSKINTYSVTPNDTAIPPAAE